MRRSARARHKKGSHMPADDTLDKIARIVEGCDLLDSRLDAMSRKDESSFKAGEPVSWTYRSGTGHGSLVKQVKDGKSAADREWEIREVDHHTGEKKHVRHFETDLRHSSKSAVEAAAKSAKARKDEDKPREPHGDVKYADPGYQADKVKRYPIDTDAHIRSAWSYIHHHRDEGKYTEPQLKRIETRIKDAWKKKIDPKGPPESREK